MTPLTAARLVITALDLLPAGLQDERAARFLLAIGAQESGWIARKQYGAGTAKGYLQFEQIGVAEVFRHPASADTARALLRMLDYPTTLTPDQVYELIEHNDLLAIGIGRLALRRHPARLPHGTEADMGWGQYLDIWAPGRPREAKWAVSWRYGWGVQVPELLPGPALPSVIV